MSDPSSTSATSDAFFSTQHCKTPDEFIAALSPREAVYRSTFPRAWVFRGHSDDRYPLVPAALRNDSAKLIELTRFPIATNESQVFAERQVLKEFLQVSDSIGLHLPEDTQTLRQWLDSSPKNIKLWPPNELLSLMALAQHHGIPTRLLDWSRHQLKAAWFAASEASKSKEKTGLLAVWALSIELLDMLGDNEPRPFIVITAPSATNSNLRAQEGLFTLAKHIVPDQSGVDRKPFDELLRTSFQKYSVKAPGPWFHRVTLPRAKADDLAFALALEGVNRATLFPDFYGVAGAMVDEARWHEGDGPGARRVREYLDSMTISYQTNVMVQQDSTSTAGQKLILSKRSLRSCAISCASSTEVFSRNSNDSFLSPRTGKPGSYSSTTIHDPCSFSLTMKLHSVRSVMHLSNHCVH